MANKDELLKTINEAFKELTKDTDDQLAEYKILLDPPGPPEVNKETGGEGGAKVSFEKYI
ncbi:MAG: hypothetical protein KAT38_03540 [Bacteroidales bacterium]|jgi:hypothetical protein|nr:hypothetical protein [Bacteroidales bacterium]